MSNSSTILHKKNYTSGVVPTVASLSSGEIAINVFDGKLFIKTTDDTIKSFSDDTNFPFILDTSLSGVNTPYGSNTISEAFSNVLGGYNNDVTGGGSTVINGENNDIDSDYSAIINGIDNKISIGGDYSVILGGSNNLISHQNSFAIGSDLISHANNFTYVNNISAQGSIYGDGSNITGVIAAGVVGPDSEVRALTANWQSTYTTVQSNSATTWNYQGTDLKSLSGNWQTTFAASSSYITSVPTGITGASQVTGIIRITQAGYNTIVSPLSGILYIIVG